MLREDPAGITKVHGVPVERRLGDRTVTLFPLFHPAAALRSTSVADLMRRDIAALARLLDRPEDPGVVE
jgi:DNA polymerase